MLCQFVLYGFAFFRLFFDNLHCNHRCLNSIYVTFCVMSTSTLVIVGVDDICNNFVLCQFVNLFYIYFVNFHSFMSTSIAVIVCIDDNHTDFVLCLLPLQLKSALMKFIYNLVLCQLPLQLYVSMKFLMHLFYANFYCN